MCLLARRQVIRVGAVHFLGGMMMRMPLCRLPLMDPPRASTMKLTRNLPVHKDTRVTPGRGGGGEREREAISRIQERRDGSHAVTTEHPNTPIKEREVKWGEKGEREEDRK